MALEASARLGDSLTIKTVGHLIHNPQALEHLAARGVGQIDSGLEGSEGALVIRAHGIPFPEYQHLASLKSQGSVRLFNGTCPEVTKVQACIKRYNSKGFSVIILGDTRHPEVVAHRSYASACIVIANLEEARTLQDETLAKAVVVAQTTFKRNDFEVITDYLLGRKADLVIRNTICRDTWKRQAEAETLVKSVDFVVVVGGKTSNNTRHLVEVAKQHGKPVQHVETAKELDLTVLSELEEIGVLAGASTPQWIVDEVVEALEQNGHPARLLRTVGRFSRIVHLPYAVTLGVLTLLLHHIMGWGHLTVSTALVTTFLLGSYAWAPYLDTYGLDTKGQARGNFLRRHQRIFQSLGTGLLLVALACAGALGLKPLICVATLFLLSWGYLAFPRQRFRILNPRRIPGSRDLGQALLPALLTAGLPWLEGHPVTVAGAAGLMACFLGAHAYHLERHIRDFQNDRILGRDLLPIAIGVVPAKWVGRAGVILGVLLMAGLALALPL